MLEIIKADGSSELEFLKKLQARAGEMSEVTTREVSVIISDIRKRGDDALKDYTLKFDKAIIKDIRLSSEEIDEAANKASPELVRIMKKAADNIRRFHEKQLPQGYMTTGEGIITGQRVLPLERVGMYVPGGTAAYPSSVLMNAIPAKVAGVGSLAMVTPVKEEGLLPSIAAAAKIAGVDEIYRVGGAQAVAALAYGTQSIPVVDKIVGPGNKYVAMAKKLVYGTVDIDMVAGPSEILIIADENSNPEYIAADLMSQAEHDIVASSVLATTSLKLAEEVNTCLREQIKKLPRRDIIESSLVSFGGAVIFEKLEQAIEFSNRIAPEHLELAMKNPFDWLGLVKNAGSVFLGEYCPEPLGDYFAGPNHVLPTNSTARFASPLGVDSFIKRSSYLYYSRQALDKVAGAVALFARSEGLDAHAASITVRSGEKGRG
ncbi:MAG: histidinol dehydrogenase [Eubacteriales bacterium]